MKIRITGTPVKGKGLGRGRGWPTANLVDKGLAPGAYVGSLISIDGYMEYRGCVITADGSGIVEVHVIGWNADRSMHASRLEVLVTGQVPSDWLINFARLMTVGAPAEVENAKLRAALTCVKGRYHLIMRSRVGSAGHPVYSTGCMTKANVDEEYKMVLDALKEGE